MQFDEWVSLAPARHIGVFALGVLSTFALIYSTI
jgi:hypothetical protein